MENEISTWVAVFTSILTLVFGSGWFQEYRKGKKAEREEKRRIIVEHLQPIRRRLQENERIYLELRQDYLEPGWGILESYLIKIRKDGIKPHALMRRRIDTVVENNNAILTNLESYYSHTRTSEFRSEVQEFRDYAIRYRDRWKALFEVYQTKAELPIAPPFPKGFPKAVEGELNARPLPDSA